MADQIVHLGPITKKELMFKYQTSAGTIRNWLKNPNLLAKLGLESVEDLKKIRKFTPKQHKIICDHLD